MRLFIRILTTTTIIMTTVIVSWGGAGKFVKIIRNDGVFKIMVNDTLLGRDLMFGSRIIDVSEPDQKVFAAGQMRNEPVMVQLSKSDNRLAITKMDASISFDAENPIAQPVVNNSRKAVTDYLTIESYDAKSGNMIIDVSGYFASTRPMAWPIDIRKRVNSFDSLNSVVLGMTEYDDHLNVRVKYRFADPKQQFQITVQYFLLLLPDKTLALRETDPRVGYQSISLKRFETGKEIRNNKFIERWRLEPKTEDIEKYKRGEIVEPSKPIVVYIEPYFPKLWMKYIKEGIESWNPAFEKAGFKNVLIAKDYPVGDSLFDPYDVSVNMVRYIPVEEANAMGYFFSDPRSGEILQGDVLWWNDVVRLLNMWRFTQTAAVDPRVRGFDYPEDVIGEMIRYSIAHEVGHMLGLQHNLRSSYAYPADSLRSPSFTQKYGTTASIMDYARYNHMARPGDLEKGVGLTPPKIGPFDTLAIEYGYRLFYDADTPDVEKQMLNQLFASKEDDPMYKFSPFIAAAISPDPAAQTESLSNDVLKSSKAGIENTKIILEHLVKWTLDNGGTPEDVKKRYDALFKQYYRYITLAMSYIGGVYTETNLADARQIKTPVATKKQKEALRFVITEICDMPKYLLNKDIAGVIDSQRDKVLKKQYELISNLLDNFILPRVVEEISVYELEEYLGDLDRAVAKTNDLNIMKAYINALKIQSEQKNDDGGVRSIIVNATRKQLNKTKVKIIE